MAITPTKSPRSTARSVSKTRPPPSEISESARARRRCSRAVAAPRARTPRARIAPSSGGSPHPRGRPASSRAARLPSQPLLPRGTTWPPPELHSSSLSATRRPCSTGAPRRWPSRLGRGSPRRCSAQRLSRQREPQSNASRTQHRGPHNRSAAGWMADSIPLVTRRPYSRPGRWAAPCRSPFACAQRSSLRSLAP